MNDRSPGPEGRNIIGDITEEESRAFFEDFCGWERLAHQRDLLDEDDEQRGIDILYKAYTPYIGEKRGVFVSVKYRTNKPFSSNIQDMVDGLADKIEKLDNSENFWNGGDGFDEEISEVSRGIIYTELENYDDQHYRNQLNDVEIGTFKIKNPLSIHMLSNYRISVFLDLVQKIKTKEEFNYDELEFLYAYYAKHGSKELNSRLGFSYLFSDIIPGRVSGHDFILSLDEPTKENIDLLFDACGSDGFQITPDVVFFSESHHHQGEEVRDRVDRSIDTNNYDWDMPEIIFLNTYPENLVNRNVEDIVE